MVTLSVGQVSVFLFAYRGKLQVLIDLRLAEIFHQKLG